MNYTFCNGELYHYGVKGQKWGVRRYEKKASKARAKAKEYKMYSDDYNSKNYTVKLKDKERAKLQANSDKYRKKANAENRKARSLEAKAKDAANKKPMTKEQAKKAAVKGVEKTAKILNKVGKVYLTDQLFFGGAGTKLAKATAMTAGRAAVTAFVMARGGYDIKWYNKYGRRVG